MTVSIPGDVDWNYPARHKIKSNFCFSQSHSSLEIFRLSKDKQKESIFSKPIAGRWLYEIYSEMFKGH